MHAKFPKSVALFCILSFICLPLNTYALPQGGAVVPGYGSAALSSTATTFTVNQVTDKVVIDYDSFSIDSGETVNFNQSSASMIALNRVRGTEVSQILGRLHADARIFLVNPNGIVFGSTAVVDVGGLLASTLGIDKDDFMAGRYTFLGDGGAVTNRGYISAPGGYVALLGSAIENTGIIEANLGTIVLASGKEIEVVYLDPQGIISVAVSQETEVNPESKDDAIKNVGTLRANGGQVLLTAAALSGLFSRAAINTEGIIEATSISDDHGSVQLLADDDILVAGKIYGGEVTVQSDSGSVAHFVNGDVTTKGDNFRGFALRKYVLKNGASIESGDGVIDIFAGDSIFLGDDASDEILNYIWQYVASERGYEFREFGYYYDDSGTLVYIPLSQGPDIGKDGLSPTQGSGSLYNIPGLEIYARFFTTGKSPVLLTWHQDPLLNADTKDHLDVAGTLYGWEDQYNLGDKDYDDAIIDFDTEQITIDPGAYLSSNTNIFLTAEKGYIRQAGGNITSDNLSLEANRGITGLGANSGIETTVNNVSAINKTENGISIDNGTNVTIANLAGLNGLNTGVTGEDGITNDAEDGAININADGSITVDAPITGYGNISLFALSNIVQEADIMIDEVSIPVPDYLLRHVINLRSASHTPSVWSNNPTIDVAWEVDDDVLPSGDKSFTAQAGGTYSMAPGSKVLVAAAGDATITGEGDVTLSLVDAARGIVTITSNNGSIIDGDLGVVPGDYDAIGRKILLSAPNGTVGQSGLEEEIDVGSPYLFTYLWDLLPSTQTDFSPDPFTTQLNPDGTWTFSTSYTVPHDSDSWWFHINLLANWFHSSTTWTKYTAPKNLGPFYIDTTPPVILASRSPLANIYGWNNTPVIVSYAVSDSLSGVDDTPSDYSDDVLDTEGTGQSASGFVYDRAGNYASASIGGINIDLTAPVITAGTPTGTQGAGGAWLSAVTVPFSATDNLSGFAPSGILLTTLASQTTPDTGINLYVTSDGISDMAGNFAPGILAGPFSIGIIPPDFAPLNASVYQGVRAYYEVIDPVRLSSVNPTGILTTYAYHPLTPTDSSAFAGIQLDPEAYEFIENNINLKKYPGYFGEIGKRK